MIGAVCTRCEPAEDIDIMRKSWAEGGPALDKPAVPYNTRAADRCCRPFEKRRHLPRVRAGESGAGGARPVASGRILFADPSFPLPERRPPVDGGERVGWRQPAAGSSPAPPESGTAPKAPDVTTTTSRARSQPDGQEGLSVFFAARCRCSAPRRHHAGASRAARWLDAARAGGAPRRSR